MPVLEPRGDTLPALGMCCLVILALFAVEFLIRIGAGSVSPREKSCRATRRMKQYTTTSTWIPLPKWRWR